MYVFAHLFIFVYGTVYTCMYACKAYVRMYVCMYVCGYILLSEPEWNTVWIKTQKYEMTIMIEKWKETKRHKNINEKYNNNNNNNSLNYLNHLHLYIVQKINIPTQTELDKKQYVYSQPKMRNSPSENR